MGFLYDRRGKRKYLTVEERSAFLAAARGLGFEVYTFCATLAYTGARISEVLSLTPEHIDAGEGVVVIESLKKRRRGVYRAIPLPPPLLNDLDMMRRVRKLTRKNSSQRIWPWSRTTAWKWVKTAMAASELFGCNACPKALRHSFGVCAIKNQAPLNMVQKWLGHSRISTTAIYADAVSDEERGIAERFWSTFE